MAEYNDPLPGAGQFIQTRWNILHGNQGRALDVANGVLCWFPNIDQTERGFVFRNSCLQEFSNFRGGNLNWQFIHKPRV